MMHLRRTLTVAAAAIAVGAAPAAAQIGFGGHVATDNDAFGGVRAAGARIRVGVPLLPVSLTLNGEYFFPRCGAADCSMYGGSADLNYALPLPLLQPWIGVGWSVRRIEIAGDERTERGINVGAGAELRLAGVRPFVELRYELADVPEKQYLLRIGLMLR